jgi:hypothetical protein
LRNQLSKWNLQSFETSHQISQPLLWIDPTEMLKSLKLPALLGPPQTRTIHWTLLTSSTSKSLCVYQRCASQWTTRILPPRKGLDIQ